MQSAFKRWTSRRFDQHLRRHFPLTAESQPNHDDRSCNVYRVQWWCFMNRYEMINATLWKIIYQSDFVLLLQPKAPGDWWSFGYVWKLEWTQESSTSSKVFFQTSRSTSRTPELYLHDQICPVWATWTDDLTTTHLAWEAQILEAIGLSKAHPLSNLLHAPFRLLHQGQGTQSL